MLFDEIDHFEAEFVLFPLKGGLFHFPPFRLTIESERGEENGLQSNSKATRIPIPL